MIRITAVKSWWFFFGLVPPGGLWYTFCPSLGCHWDAPSGLHPVSLCAGVSVHSCTAALSLCVSLACGRTVGADNTIDQTRCRYVLKCLSSFETNHPRKKKSVFWSEVQRVWLHSGILTSLFHDNLEQSNFVTLQLNPIEDVVASRLKDSKGYLFTSLSKTQRQQ